MAEQPDELGPLDAELCRAADGGDRGGVARCLDAGANPSAVDQGWPVLLGAASAGDSGVVRLLVQANADVDAAVATGATSLFVAAQNGHAGVIEALLAGRADPNIATAKGVTPLLVAAQNGRTSAVEALLAGRADPWRPALSLETHEEGVLAQFNYRAIAAKPAAQGGRGSVPELTDAPPLEGRPAIAAAPGEPEPEEPEPEREQEQEPDPAKFEGDSAGCFCGMLSTDGQNNPPPENAAPVQKQMDAEASKGSQPLGQEEAKKAEMAALMAVLTRQRQTRRRHSRAE